MRTLFLTLCYASFFIVGVSAPFVLTLGYLWVDTFLPQTLAYGVISQLPVSQIVAIGAIGSYFVLDRRDPPRLSFITVLLILFAAWVTISTFTWAVLPGPAQVKWSAVVKTLLFTPFIPLVIRSRVQIEAFLQIWLFGFAINYLPPGLKALLSGGGYGRDLGIGGNGVGGFALADDARLAMIAFMLVPIILFLCKHTILLPRIWLTRAMYLAIIVISFGAAYGTYERTAVVVGAVLMGLLWLKSRHKVILAVGFVLCTAVAVNFVSPDWLERMSTMSDSHEASAEHRLDVWMWTLGYVSEHPLGGGFEVYIIDHAGAVRPDGTRASIAYHNDFFEVLAEQGWPGLAIFVALIGSSVLYLRSAARRARAYPQLAWVPDLAVALQMALVLQLTGGSFVALGYHPPLYMIFALAISLREYVHRVAKATQSGAAATANADRGRSNAPLAPLAGAAAGLRALRSPARTLGPQS